MATAGPMLSRTKDRESFPEFPAASICEAITCFKPSPVLKVTRELNVPLVQFVVTEAARPEPFNVTFKPVSQVPLTVAVGATKLFAKGLVIAIAGAVVSRRKILESLPVLPPPST